MDGKGVNMGLTQWTYNRERPREPPERFDSSPIHERSASEDPSSTIKKMGSGRAQAFRA